MNAEGALYRTIDAIMGVVRECVSGKTAQTAPSDKIDKSAGVPPAPDAKPPLQIWLRQPRIGGSTPRGCECR